MKRMSVVFLLLVGSAVAQFDEGTNVRQLRVQIEFLDRACDGSTHVALMGRKAGWLTQSRTISVSWSSQTFPQEATI
jgi:hypothetical protein